MRRFHLLILVIVTILLLPGTSLAQGMDNISVQTNDSIADIILLQDSLAIDSIYRENIDNSMMLVADSSRAAKKRSETFGDVNANRRFIPNPQKATWLAVVFPGAGQIYNRKFWKLPIVYGGFIGCLYAFNWNSQMYSDYRQGYLDIMDSDPNTKSYEDFFRPGYDFDKNKEYIKEVFKKRKDRYRRWRDLSVFAFIGVYALSVIDAYVDAQLSSFDISDDLNMSIHPEFMHGNSTGTNENFYGLNCNIRF